MCPTVLSKPVKGAEPVDESGSDDEISLSELLEPHYKRAIMHIARATISTDKKTKQHLVGTARAIFNERILPYCLDEVLMTNPNDTIANNLVVGSYFHQGKKHEALKHLRPSMLNDFTRPIWSDLRKLYLAHAKEAITIVERLVREHPALNQVATKKGVRVSLQIRASFFDHKPELRHSIGTPYAASNTLLTIADEFLELLLKMEPENKEFYMLQAKTQCLQKRYPEAEQAINKAKALDKKNQASYDLHARILRSQGKEDEAEAVLSTSPDHRQAAQQFAKHTQKHNIKKDKQKTKKPSAQTSQNSADASAAPDDVASDGVNASDLADTTSVIDGVVSVVLDDDDGPQPPLPSVSRSATTPQATAAASPPSSGGNAWQGEQWAIEGAKDSNVRRTWAQVVGISS